MVMNVGRSINKKKSYNCIDDKVCHHVNMFKEKQYQELETNQFLLMVMMLGIINKGRSTINTNYRFLFMIMLECLIKLKKDQLEINWILEQF